MSQATFVEVLQTSFSASKLLCSVHNDQSFLCHFTFSNTGRRTHACLHTLVVDLFRPCTVQMWWPVDVNRRWQSVNAESEISLYVSLLRLPVLVMDTANITKACGERERGPGFASTSKRPLFSMQKHAHVLPVGTCLVLPGPALRGPLLGPDLPGFDLPKTRHHSLQLRNYAWGCVSLRALLSPESLWV